MKKNIKTLLLLSMLLIPVFSLFGQEKNDVFQLKWIKQIQTDAEKFYENGTRISYLNIYGEIPEIYVQSIADQVKENPSVLRFYLYYGKEYSECMCEAKDDFTNEQLAVVLDGIIDRYYTSGGNLIDKEKFEQEQKMAEMELSANSKTDTEEDYLKDAAPKSKGIIAACVPTTSSGSTYYISNFTTTGGTTNINNNSGSSATGYQDFYNTVSMSANTGTAINYTITCSSSSDTYGRAIWVDWNENDVFEASEQVVSSTSYASPPLTGSFAIPVGTFSGSKRMRILISYTPSNPSNPCNNSGSGEYEDYKIIVQGVEMKVPASGDNSYTTCSGHLYDNGGSTGNYANSSNGYTVLYPGTSGYKVQVSGTITCESGYDYLTIYDGIGTGGTVLWGGSAHGSGTSCNTFTVPLIVSTTGPLTIKFYSNNSTSCAGFDLAISCVSPDAIIGAGNCEDAVSFCASNQSSGYNFEITSESVPYPPGQCHFLKNPSWWYMQIAEAGNVVLKIASSCGDVDYSCYGPFNNPTCDSTDLSATGTFPYYYGNHKVTYHKSTHPSEPIDLSTTETPFCKVGTLAEPVGNLVDFGGSTAAVEYLQIRNAKVGEYYVVIIGNFGQCAGNIDFTQTNIGQPDAASLNCDIVIPCNITSVTVTPTYDNDSTHSVTGNINFTNPPTDGFLKICYGSICQTFTPPFVSPQAYTLTGIPSDTLMNTLLAEFTSSTVNCARPVNYILQGNLPVELTSLSAYCKNNEVLLYWTTASEINNDYFEIQRSKNDIDWEVIAKVKGAGFSNTIKNYKYLDKECPNANFYYRLRQVDYDGKSQLSDIISIRCENIIEKPEISIYPNPFNSKLNIEFKNWDLNVAEIELLDLTSRVIQKWNLQNTLSSFVHEVNLSNLNPSIYVIKIKTSDGVIIRKVEKR